MSNNLYQNPKGKNLTLQFNVIENAYKQKDQFRAELIFTNNSSLYLKNNWSIYFNFLRKIIPDTISPGFDIKHINGDFFSMEPTTDYVSIAPNETVKITFTAEFWAIKEVDAPTGFYIVYRDNNKNELPPQPLPPVSIGEFTHPEQLIRGLNDNKPIPTSTTRYFDAKDLNVIPKQSLIPILPTPYLYKKNKGSLSLKSSSKIAFQQHLKNEAEFLSDFIKTNYKIQFELVEIINSHDHDKAPIKLTTDNTIKDNSEAYKLTVNESGIDIIANHMAGVFYGIQSLLQIMNYVESSNTLEVPFIEIEDKPQFTYRGLHLDVSRNFHKEETIKKLFKQISFYKLNKFHFHLTDDEGWRIEIPGLPELTEIGARRGHTFMENDHLLPSYGSGADPDNPNSSGNGFYTRETFIELLKYAHKYHIEVIPAIDFPSHARAAVRAMEVRYDKFKALGDLEKANEFLLTDFEDTSEYETVQMWQRNVVNIGMASTYRFAGKVFDEILLMYKEAGVKLSTIHIGGDEVPDGAWLNSPMCKNLIKKHDELKTIHDLFNYFITRLNEVISSKGLRMSGWEEIGLVHKGKSIEPNKVLVNQNLITYAWNTLWGESKEEMPYKLANLGYKVVLANAPSLYFDLAYDKDPKEEGYYWAGYTGTEDVFKFIPMDYYQSAETDVLGNTINAKAQYTNAERLTDKGKQNILGIQAQLWSETINSRERLEYLLFPRLFALAERAWAKQPDWVLIKDSKLKNKAYKEDWNQFMNRVSQIELPRLDSLFGDVQYRIPPTGGIIKNGLLHANTEYPGFIIRILCKRVL